MSGLTPIDLTRFTQVCGMLGSDHMGERAAAAAAATKMLRAAGLTWADLLGGLSVLLRNTATAAEGDGKVASDGEWLACDIVRACAARMDDLTEWQQDFVANTLVYAERFGSNFRMSPKQWAQFHKIMAQLQERAA